MSSIRRIKTWPKIFKDEYEKLVSAIKDPHIRKLFGVLSAKKAMLEKFFLFPASVGVHHVYMGGLLEHSVSMAKMGRHAATVLGGNVDVIVAGAFSTTSAKSRSWN